MKCTKSFSVRKLHTWFLLLLVFALGTSCSRNAKVVTKFPVDKKIESRNIAALDTLYTAYAVTKLGNKFVFTVKKKEKFLYIYNEDFTPLGCTLNKGNGNNEWFAPLITGQEISVVRKQYACVLERSNHTLYAVNLNDLNSERVRLTDFKSKELNDINYAYKTDENSFIGAEQAKQTDLFVYDKSSGKTKIIQPQGIDPAIFAADKFGLSQTISTYNGGHRKLAVAYFSFPLMCVMNSDGSGCTTVQIGKTLPQYKGGDDMDNDSYFLDMCSTQERIYTLYDDHKSKNEMSILAFDWEGNPVARYRVPRLTSFTVDESGKRFIAIQEDDSDGVCIEMKYE